MPRRKHLLFSAATDCFMDKVKTKVKRHVNIPVFIPHIGCPNTCVFCNQRKISGVDKFSVDEITRIVNESLATCDKDTYVEIAFFGGSFTGIPREDMISILEVVKPYIDSGRVSALRCSTRPDYIDHEILDILTRYGMKTIELGIQSMSDKVLKASKRGHTADCSVMACKMIKESGFSLVGQMMTGLPGSTADNEIMTARMLCELKCDAVRIYPTMVFKETELENMLFDGRYISPNIHQTVQTVADILEIFDENNIDVIRVGLCASEGLLKPDGIVCGEYHPAFGEMAKAEVFRRRLISAFDNSTDLHRQNINVFCPLGMTSAVAGYNRANKEYLKTHYGVKKIKITETDTLQGYSVKVDAIL